MSADSSAFVLPRPGGVTSTTNQVISAPSEPAFTETFGTLLPPAKYLKTPTDKAAYYEFSSSSSDKSAAIPDRVLLIHGLQTPALGLLPLTRALKELFPRTHFVLFDLWGHGLSDTPILPHVPNLFRQLIDELLNELKWSYAHLIGFSFGGSLIADYVTKRPSQVQSFTLIAPARLLRSSELNPEGQSHFRGVGDETAAQKWILRWLEGGELIVPADWKESVREGKVVAAALKEWQLREHAGHAASVVAIFRDGGAFDRHCTFIEAARTGIPSFAILGELDNVCSVKDLQDVGISNVVIVAQTGHEVVREKVPEVSFDISSFWKTLKKGNSS